MNWTPSFLIIWSNFVDVPINIFQLGFSSIYSEMVHKISTLLFKNSLSIIPLVANEQIRGKLTNNEIQSLSFVFQEMKEINKNNILESPCLLHFRNFFLLIWWFWHLFANESLKDYIRVKNNNRFANVVSLLRISIRWTNRLAKFYGIFNHTSFQDSIFFLFKKKECMTRQNARK